jgi:D-2-hydroxyacid dehydrogenase (NADP+)
LFHAADRRRVRCLPFRGSVFLVLACYGSREFPAWRQTSQIDPKDMPLNPYVSRMVYPEEIDSVLPLADVLFISAPLTAKSQGMIGPRQFELLKKSAYFVAVSRGKVYNTDALVKALDSRQLAGAGLDVTNPEPLPKEHALWKFDNVVITPHIAGQSDNVSARQMALFKENIARFVHGQPLMNVVDKQKGY